MSSVDRLLERLLADPASSERLLGHRIEEAVQPRHLSWPDALDPRLLAVLERRGIARPWAHQAAAARAILDGHSTVIATPTASGKSLCYNAPILSEILQADADHRPAALYLFPTKALSQDQVAELNELVAELKTDAGEEARIGAWTYDGDTPADLRRRLRERGDVVVTNPFMLHVSILPNHLRWGHFFRRLKWVVIDELHTYAGIYGSSVNNVIRRLKRIARHYGAEPKFIAASATIQDPGGHFAQLIEERPKVVAESGAPRGERHHLFWNPPILNEDLGLRARAVDEARSIGRMLLEERVPALVFGRSRSTVEVLVKYLKDQARDLGRDPERVVGYRGGYLPLLRRRIEEGLRAGTIDLVVATNALELGVDIGSLDAVVMTGYPGTVASYHQQAGRAGRRSGKSLCILVGQSAPLDQYVMRHPEMLLNGQGETAPIDADNLVIATNHLKCAAFELPFHEDDAFGRFPHTPELLRILAAPDGVLLGKAGRYHWMDETYPAEGVSLDAFEMDTFLVFEDLETAPTNRHQGKTDSLGHVDRFQALTSLHPEAIYQHQGTQYQITDLDWDGRRAYAKRVDVDYYTEAETDTDVQVLCEDGREEHEQIVLAHGDVHVTTIATLFKRIRFYTNENLETGPIDLPPEELDTTAFMLVIGEELQALARFSESTRAGAVHGLATLLAGVAPLFVQLGRGALRARGFATHQHFEAPAVFLWDAAPGGIGLAENLYREREALLRAARDRLHACGCTRGCPSCIGIGGERGRPAREAADIVLQHAVEALARARRARGLDREAESRRLADDPAEASA